MNCLFKGDSIKTNENADSIVLDTLNVERLRKLTFTHGFIGNSYSKELTWQAILENGDSGKPSSNRKDPKYVTHGIHPYKGKFYPQLAKSLLNIADLKEGGTILDPFCGSGTVLLESYLNGYKSFGLDLNPLAVRIAKAKTDILKVNPLIFENVTRKFLEDLNMLRSKKNKEVFDLDVLEELNEWFSPLILNKLSNAVSLIAEVPDKTISEFLEICLSSIIRDVSHQEPKDLRIRRRKVSLEDAPIKDILTKKVLEQLNKVLKFHQKINFAPSPFGSTKILHGDCRSLETFTNAGIKHKRVDAIITSPPYATALPYIDTDRLSILILFGKKSKERTALEKSLIGAREINNIERNKLEERLNLDDFEQIHSKTAQSLTKKVFKLNNNSEVGFRRKNMASLLYRYFNDMSLVLSNLDKVVKTNSNLFFVIGDNKTLAGEENINIQSGKVLKEMGLNLGWKLIRSIEISVTQENRLHNKNGITTNEIIWFQQ